MTDFFLLPFFLPMNKAGFPPMIPKTRPDHQEESGESLIVRLNVFVFSYYIINMGLLSYLLGWFELLYCKIVHLKENKRLKDVDTDLNKRPSRYIGTHQISSYRIFGRKDKKRSYTQSQ